MGAAPILSTSPSGRMCRLAPSMPARGPSHRACGRRGEEERGEGLGRRRSSREVTVCPRFGVPEAWLAARQAPAASKAPGRATSPTLPFDSPGGDSPSRLRRVGRLDEEEPLRIVRRIHAAAGGPAAVSAAALHAGEQAGWLCKAAEVVQVGRLLKGVGHVVRHVGQRRRREEGDAAPRQPRRHRCTPSCILCASDARRHLARAHEVRMRLGRRLRDGESAAPTRVPRV